MAKIIHYCWFGGKPLSKLSKKCIKSWEKYLPDFEIKRWDESNVDLEECPFIKEAYEQKKWAFVADYARAKALYEYGGIYFDTDMEVTKDITKLLKDETFLGVEDSGNIAVGVWWEKHEKSFLSEYLLKFYREQKHFNVDDLYSIAIPKIITNELKKYGYVLTPNKIQTIKKVKIYPRDYFYPISYDRQNNLYTDNTCMIHYYDATWVPKWEQEQIKLIRKYGREKADKISRRRSSIKSLIKKSIKICLYPAVYLRRKYKENKLYTQKGKDFIKDISTIKNNSNIIITNPNWLGTTFATKELFGDTLPIKEIGKRENIEKYATKIIEKNPKLIIFSAFELSWKKLVIKIKEQNPNQRIKIIWHGSNAMNIEKYDFAVLKTIFYLLENNYIESIAFVKKSMYELYKEKGYNVEFLQNSVDLSNINIKKEEHENTKIGLYASGDRWVKNFYNQLAGASLIENALIDIVPLSQTTIDFAKILKCNVVGKDKPVKREELLERMAQNDINVYVTFVDCAPIIPLESFELGIPCITGNNHHYWDGTELEKYVVVDKADNSLEIAKKIEYCLKHKDKIMKLYKEWKKNYDIETEKIKEEFLK